jgi:hypothetical protein
LRIALCAVLLFCFGAATVAFAQHESTVSGIVADPTGAVIPGATIHVATHAPSTFHPPDATSNAVGRYTLSLPSGIYDITVAAAGFSPSVAVVTLPRTDAAKYLNITLSIAPDAEQLNVSANQNSTSAADNKSAVVLGKNQLATLSDDDTTFQQEIEAIAGADPMEPSGVYVDGFSGGKIPPKDTIREVRINQNPYSAQFQDLGFGRVEISTKPGSDKLHGHLMVNANDSGLNTQNPFVGTQPPYYALFLRGNVSGPIGKKTSYFVSGVYNDQQTNSVINALATDTGSLSAVNYAVPSPSTNTDDSFRLDRQVTVNNVFTARYELNRSSATNAGLDSALQTLPSEAFGNSSTIQTLQLSDSQDIGKNKTLETRFQYIRSRINQNPNSTAPTVSVEGYFNGGGSSSQVSRDNQDMFEYQEYFSLEHKQHFFRMGGRFRSFRDSNFSNANFNGQYTYSPTSAAITALDNYESGTPSQLTITTGSPSASVLITDTSIYADDEWKLRKELTIDYGFRAETQSAIPDHFDPAPRIGVAWAVGQTAKKSPIVTLRAGFGLFYDRFGLAQWGQTSPTYLLTAVRRSTGTLQQSYIFANPPTPTGTCLSAPTPSCGGNAVATQPTLYSVSPKLRSEYQVVEGITAERNIGKIGSVTINYLHEQGDHQWTSLNINAPLPGTFVYGNPASGVRPLGGTQNIYQFTPNGDNKTDMIFLNVRANPTKKINLWAFTGYRRKVGDSHGVTAFPTNQYDLSQDFGRYSSPQYRLFTGGDFQLPLGLTADLFVAFLSHQPFNITTGTDSNGDSIYNDRPSFATAASPTVDKTPYGNFDPTPQPGEKIIPFNYGNGPRFAYTQLGLHKSFQFGKPPAPPPTPAANPGLKGKLPPPPKPQPPYEISFGLEADNIFNHTNAAAPVGVLTSPQFGQSTQLNSNFTSISNANRLILFFTTFNF